MSVNLKGRKSAKSEAEAPAPQELVMAGAQTPWATEQPSGSPFAEDGMPSLPPPPPPYAPGEEPAEAEADGKKSPFSKPMVLALAAVIVLGGGGYYYLNMSSSSSTPAPTTHALTPAQLAALRAKAAAAAKAGKPATPVAGTAAKPAAGGAGAAKPPATPAKGGTAPAKTGAPAKAATKPKPAAKTTVTATQTSSTPTYTAALPGAINGWDKQIVKKAPATLATFDNVLGASITNLQVGVFGGTAKDPLLAIETGDHSKNPTAKAMDLLKQQLTVDRARGVAVSEPFFVSHAPWGGSAACATESGINIPSGVDESAVVCTWIDTNTFGLFVAPHRIAAQALPLLNSIRSQVEH